MSGRPLRIFVMGSFAFLTHMGPSSTRAGSITYEWGPLTGSGYHIAYPGNQETTFTTNDAWLSVVYDPDNPSMTEIELSSGSPGYWVLADTQVRILASSTSLCIAAFGSNGQYASVSFAGNVGPLNAQGDPVSVGCLAGASVTASGNGGYHDEFSFTVQSFPEAPAGVQSVPEPSAFVLGATAMAILAGWLRRHR
jgi:hypothetical protein